MFSLFFFRAMLVAYGGSQARGWIGAVAASLHHSSQQRQIRGASETYTTAHGNTGPLTHWARPEIEPKTSWFLVKFVSDAPWRELLCYFYTWPLFEDEGASQECLHLVELEEHKTHMPKNMKRYSPTCVINEVQIKIGSHWISPTWLSGNESD